jgi:hypothetical protein
VVLREAEKRDVMECVGQILRMITASMNRHARFRNDAEIVRLGDLRLLHAESVPYVEFSLSFNTSNNSWSETQFTARSTSVRKAIPPQRRECP